MENKEVDILTPRNIRSKYWTQFIFISLVAVAFSLISMFIRLRIDLTEDNRYTLSVPTHRILTNIKNDIFIQVYLDGEMEIAFKKLRRSVKEILEEFHIASAGKVDYQFINPSEGKDSKSRETQYQTLINKGLTPVNIRARDNEGRTSQKILFPGMIVNFNGIEVPVNFLSNNTYLSPEQNLLHSIEGLEYQLIQVISTLCSDTVYKVAFLEGHGESPEIEVADATFSLAKFFTIDRGSIGGKTGILDKYAAVVIAGPETAFSEKDKLVLDQYIMKGGKVLWLLEEVRVNEDSLNNGETVALYRPLNIEDQLFRYGVRINPVIVEDVECMQIPINIMTGNSGKQMVFLPWIYYPLLSPSPESPITRNLNKVLGRFTNYIDTVGLDTQIKKKILLSTSIHCRTVGPPLLISLNEANSPPDPKLFNKSALPVAVLLEGKFQSAFHNRPVDDLVMDRNFKITDESRPSKMIIAADGNLIRNGVSRTGSGVVPLPLATDKYTGGTFGNKDFIINCLNYLVDDNGIMELRSRELKLRLLDKDLIRNNRFMIQVINTALPVVLVIIAGVCYNFFRKRRYTNSL
jgi:ABC-2 type transport system permease protein